MVVNSIGTIADLKNGSFDWNGKIEAKGGLTDGHKLPAAWAMPEGKYWFAEIKVPFAELGISPPHPGELWGLNVAVNRAKPWAILAPATKGTAFSNTATFPVLECSGSGGALCSTDRNGKCPVRQWRAQRAGFQSRPE